MASTDDSSPQNYEVAPTCASGTSIIYAWALDADKTELPKGKLARLKKQNFNKKNMFQYRCCF